MSAINLNMQDNIIKSSLVQQIQGREVDINRSHEQAAQAFQEEMSRQAEESVEELDQSENEGIREELGHEGQHGKKKREQEEEDEEDKKDGWVMGPDDDGEPHTINIIA